MDSVFASDTANLYDVETKRIDEAVKNTPDKFSDGHIIELKNHKWKLLESIFSTSNKSGKVKISIIKPFDFRKERL